MYPSENPTNMILDGSFLEGGKEGGDKEEMRERRAGRRMEKGEKGATRQSPPCFSPGFQGHGNHNNCSSNGPE